MKKISFLLFIFLLTMLDMYGGFRAGTLVRTPSGQVPIEALRVGDLVVSWVQDRSVVYKVIHKQSKTEHNCYCIEVAGKQIVMSANQKFYVASQDVWKKACDLTTQDILYCAHGEHVTIDDAYQLEWDTEFFDITVEKAHNFYVTKQLILVHNKSSV